MYVYNQIPGSMSETIIRCHRQQQSHSHPRLLSSFCDQVFQMALQMMILMTSNKECAVRNGR